jgi:hypothetical protein
MISFVSYQQWWLPMDPVPTAVVVVGVLCRRKAIMAFNLAAVDNVNNGPVSLFTNLCWLLLLLLSTMTTQRQDEPSCCCFCFFCKQWQP